MYQPLESTRIGLSYRSTVKYKAKGNTDISRNGKAMASFTASADVNLPDTAILSVMHQFTARLTVLGDLSWTGWSSIPELTIRNQGGPSSALDLRFRDTWRFALGANYRVTERWTWKVGVAVDQSPIRSAEKRPTALPDNNRLWLSTGVHYHYSAYTTVDMGYTYLHLKKNAD